MLSRFRFTTVARFPVRIRARPAAAWANPWSARAACRLGRRPHSILLDALLLVDVYEGVQWPGVAQAAAGIADRLKPGVGMEPNIYGDVQKSDEGTR